MPFRKLALFLALVFMPLLALAQTSTLSGTINGSNGSPLNSGSVTFLLMNCGGSPTSGQTIYTFTLSPVAVLSGTVQINSQTGCLGNSYYQVAAYAANAVLNWRRNYQVTASTFNLATASQLSPLPPPVGGGGGSSVSLDTNGKILQSFIPLLPESMITNLVTDLSSNASLANAALPANGCTTAAGGLLSCNKVTIGSEVLNATTIASLPPATALNRNTIMLVSDSSAAGNCSTGGGAFQSMCLSTGTAWISPGGATGGVGPTGPSAAAMTVSTSTISVTATANPNPLLFRMSPTTGTTVTLTLPSAPSAGEIIYIKNVGAGSVTVAGNGHTIDGLPTFSMPNDPAAQSTVPVAYDSTSGTWNIF